MLFDKLRAICLALPTVNERHSHGEPAWFIKGKRQFAVCANHHHDDRVAVWVAAPAGSQEMLIESNPTKFFRPPYVGHRGWVGIYLDVEVDWDEVADIVEEGYRWVARPRK